MNISLQAGEFTNVQTPSGETLNVEHTIDSFYVCLGSRVVYSEIKEEGIWTESYPGRPPEKLGKKGRDLKPKEAYEIGKTIEHRVGNFFWWRDRNGWHTEFFDQEGNHVYRAPLESDTNAMVSLTISPTGKRTLIIENI